MTKSIHNLSSRQAYELQAYLAPTTRGLGSLGVGWRDEDHSQKSDSRVEYLESRWALLRDKLEHEVEVSSLIEELIEALRNPEAA